jgi:signal transduction histidine kinase
MMDAFMGDPIEEKGGETARERVLVVDDSLVYQDLIVNHILTPNGYEALVAHDGQEGLAVALQKAPDLIITDLRMPGLDGIGIVQALREAERDIPVILMTLHGSEELVVQAFRLGVRDYVSKPFDVDEMLAAIDRALRELRLRRERDALTRDLMRVNRELEAVLTQTEDGVLVVGDDPKGRIVLINASACTAFGIEGDVSGRPVGEVIDDETLSGVFDEVRTTGEPSRVEIVLPDDRTLNAQVTPIPTVGQVAVMQDITQLKEIDRVKSELVSTVSHDLRSPLTSIKGFADLLEMAGELNDKQSYFVSKIQHGVDNVTEMISDLLDLGRIEAEARMEMKLCDLSAIVDQALTGLRDGAEIKGQALVVERAPVVPPVWGNPLRLGQAVSNLIGNAIKYTPEGGRIEIEIAAQEGQVIMTVSDDGIGIPADDLAHIFEKFYRVKGPETDGIAGSGLGLSLVKSIVEKHNGRIWVRSEAGVGSAFTIVLDVAKVQGPGKGLPPADSNDARQVVEVTSTS